MECPAWVILSYWFVLQRFSGAGQIGHSDLSQGGVAWFAHSGGFLAGIALIYLLPTRPVFRSRPEMHW